GLGENYDGVIFVLDMGNREGQIITSGKAIDIYTDYYIDQMWDNMVDYLSGGDYYNAFFSLYMDMNELAGEYEQYQTDPDSFISDYSKAQKQKSIFTSLGIAAIFSLVIAAFAVSSMKKACRNVRPYTDGRAYLKENGFYLTTNQDSFATTHTSMMPIPRDDDDHHSGGIGGSWGGGSSTFSGGGRSFGGGGGKF
ncbi:MAG: TPM domain-containing protein, partial [Anaerotignum sp.]|nr:TPM domain-containing protein [Anaerotignum sp.]